MMGPAQSDITLTGILSRLKQGKTMPCYLIYGDEDYLVKDALQKIIDALLPPGSRELNLFTIDGEKENPDAIREFLLTPPLIPGEKVVVVNNPDFLRSTASLPQVMTKAIEALDTDPAKAAKHFMTFLKKSGWKLDDLENGNWKSIPDADWKKLLSGEEFEKRGQWLPRMLELCHQYGLTDAADSGTFDLEELLQVGIPQGNYLILTAGSVDKRKTIYKTIAEMGVVLDFTKTKNESRQREIAADIAREILAGSGKTLSPARLAGPWKKDRVST